jgi:predicted RNase H-like HicB family nuclease
MMGAMERVERVTALIEREGNGYLTLCPELDIASQGATFEEAHGCLHEALAMFVETLPRP